jgi:hypothetical protein
MRYVITKADKRRQTNILRQIWRFTVLSRRFMKLIRQGSCKHVDRSAGSKAA